MHAWTEIINNLSETALKKTIYLKLKTEDVGSIYYTYTSGDGHAFGYSYPQPTVVVAR